MFYIFEDLCTVNELESLAQRFEVASMLYDKHTYLEVADKTGASHGNHQPSESFIELWK